MSSGDRAALHQSGPIDGHRTPRAVAPNLQVATPSPLCHPPHVLWLNSTPLPLPTQHRYHCAISPNPTPPHTRLSQCRVGVFAYGPSGHELSSSYRNRDSDAAKMDLGNALINFARIIPQGMLVFFPSYSALQAMHAAWISRNPSGAPSIIDRLLKHKHVVVEPRESSACNAAVEEYLSAVHTRGAVLLAVCRGKLSEGVDFSDAACRGVAIVGVPLPPIFDAQVVLKREFLDRKRAAAGQVGEGALVLSGEVWYQQQAMRAINQAVGRVIRHINDFGAVMLCESRFKQNRWVEGLSLWLRQDVQQFESFGKGLQSLQQFFRGHRNLMSNSAAQAAPADLIPHDGGPRQPATLRPPPPLPLPPPPAPSLLSALQGVVPRTETPTDVPVIPPTGESPASTRPNKLRPSGTGECDGSGSADAVRLMADGEARSSSGAGPPTARDTELGRGIREGLLEATGAGARLQCRAARPRASWAPQQVPQLACEDPSNQVVLCKKGDVTAAKADGASRSSDSSIHGWDAGVGKGGVRRCDGGGVVASGGTVVSSKEEGASKLLELARSTLSAFEYEQFIGLIRDLKAIKDDGRSEVCAHSSPWL